MTSILHNKGVKHGFDVEDDKAAVIVPRAIQSARDLLKHDKVMLPGNIHLYDLLSQSGLVKADNAGRCVRKIKISGKYGPVELSALTFATETIVPKPDDSDPAKATLQDPARRIEAHHGSRGRADIEDNRGPVRLEGAEDHKNSSQGRKLRFEPTHKAARPTAQPLPLSDRGVADLPPLGATRKLTKITNVN